MRAGPRAESAWPSRSAPTAPGVTATGQERLARIRRAADFERVLQTRPRAISTHFALHHVAASIVCADGAMRGWAEGKLSTERTTVGVLPVDDFEVPGLIPPAAKPKDPLPSAVGLGLVVPKRHARRAVTRSLLKRQMRAAAQARADRLAAGLWVVRLRASFERATYPSAASAALQGAARSELDELMRRAVDPSDSRGRRSP